MSACPDCGAAVEPENMADHLMRHGILPEERPEAFGPKSPGADSDESPPADSAEGSSAEGGLRLRPDALMALHSARSDLAAVNRELDKVGTDDGFKALLAATRAQAKIQAAADLIDGAWVDLGGQIPDAEQAPANGGTEGEAAARAAGMTQVQIEALRGAVLRNPGRVLDVTGFPLTTRDRFETRLTAALAGFKGGAGAYPDKVRMLPDQRDVLDGGDTGAVCGIPIEVLGEHA